MVASLGASGIAWGYQLFSHLRVSLLDHQYVFKFYSLCILHSMTPNHNEFTNEPEATRACGQLPHH